MITIIFEAHGTTFDNKAHLASGFNDVDLSPLGEIQAKELGERYQNDNFDVIFCSDLVRSWRTAEIAFGDKFLIIKDFRLRECDYGDYTKHSSEEVDLEKPKRISVPFPNGESYMDTNKRMKEFLDEIKEKYLNKKIMIIGHRATQYALDYFIKGVSLEDSTCKSFKWQPGWEYSL